MYIQIVGYPIILLAFICVLSFFYFIQVNKGCIYEKQGC